jgi:hypothetical protein
MILSSTLAEMIWKSPPHDYYFRKGIFIFSKNLDLNEKQKHQNIILKLLFPCLD